MTTQVNNTAKKVDYLIIGAGMSGLSFACSILQEHKNKGLDKPSVLILEKDSTVGGYCKTVHQDGFVWDYSGHFFHFKNKDIEDWLVERMPKNTIKKINKKSKIIFKNTWIDFPFQKNIHQLPKEDFIDCLYHLYFKDEHNSANKGDANKTSEKKNQSFKDMLFEKFGKGISERFLIPYNEKLYATDLDELDASAMGRFFPYANLDEIIKNMKVSNNESYNSHFTYPKGGAIEYVYAFSNELEKDNIAFNEALISIDSEQKTAQTEKREIQYQHLITSAPFPKVMQSCDLDYEKQHFSANEVLVFNLGFDKKGPKDIHWVYFPEKDIRFYRAGFYDNIHEADRMSLYIEIGAKENSEWNIEAELERVLADLKKVGIITDHKLVSSHNIVLNPAYVHIREESMREFDKQKQLLNDRNIYPVGRYGGWTYCSIEDNIIETRALAKELS